MTLNLNRSNQYREKIHSLIPGGAHTYSKGDDQFPVLSPAAISRGKGCYIWDLDENKYLDCAMGLTSVSLGHAYEPVLERVRLELEKGVNFQRPSYIEMEGAERFLSLVPKHDMIKFAKNGSTVTTAAVKLARAFTGRDIVAFPSDHPFYSYDDWFISSTACNKGVPRDIGKLSTTFKFSDLDTLRDLFDKYPEKIACVITEPEKSIGTTKEHLLEIKRLCEKNGAVLIFDEMVSGFKTDFPGAISKFGVIPDLATWGKGIANGFSFCALTGKKEIMNLGGILNTGAEKVFLISSTHGGETHAIAAAIATIDVFEKENVIKHNHGIGKIFCDKIIEISTKKKMTSYIKLTPCEWFPIVGFLDKNNKSCDGLYTLMLQEMFKRGVLFQGVFTPCFSHTVEDIDFFADAFEQSLGVYEKALDSGYEKFLVGPKAKAVFRKYL